MNPSSRRLSAILLATLLLLGICELSQNSLTAFASQDVAQIDELTSENTTSPQDSQDTKDKNNTLDTNNTRNTNSAKDTKEKEEGKETKFHKDLQNAGSLIIRLRCSDTDEYIEGAAFTLYQWSERKKDYVELMKLKSYRDSHCKPYYSNERAYERTEDNQGRFCIAETGAPKGCVRSLDPWEYELSSEKPSHTFDNELQKVQLKFHVYGEEKENIESVQFRVKALEDIRAPWAKEGEDTSLLIGKGTIVDTISSDEDGIAISTDGCELYVGDYSIEPISGAPGYLLSGQAQTIHLSYLGDDRLPIQEFAMDLPQIRMNPSVSVALLADRSHNGRGEEPQFDEKSGRYTEKKVPGIYEAGSDIDYKITLTNTGNVSLREIALYEETEIPEEISGYSLQDCLQEQGSFILPQNETIISSLGARISVVLDREKGILTLEELQPEDSVLLHYKGKLQPDIGNRYRMRNHVSVSARYRISQDEGGDGNLETLNTDSLLDKEGNPLAEDWDDISIPGEPLVRVAVMADATEGATLEEGRYKGKKMEGIYEYGEMVDYTITVTNYGSADLYQILVRDTLDPQLFQSLDESSILFREGTYRSSYDAEVHAVKHKEKESGRYSLLLDYLAAGDSVELHLQGRIRSGQTTHTSYKNTVEVTAEYQKDLDTFESLESTLLMKDSDAIFIGVPSLCVAMIGDRSQGLKLQTGRYQGKRTAAVYEEGEKVFYTITVSNTGTGKAKKLRISNTISERAQCYLTPLGYNLTSGEKIRTEMGNIVTVETSGSKGISFDGLESGDSFEIQYQCSIKDRVKNVNNLWNQASLTARYCDDRKMIQTEEMKDKEYISLRKRSNAFAAYQSYGSRGNPDTGDHNHPARSLLAMCASLLLMRVLCKKKQF